MRLAALIAAAIADTADWVADGRLPEAPKLLPFVVAADDDPDEFLRWAWSSCCLRLRRWRRLSEPAAVLVAAGLEARGEPAALLVPDEDWSSYAVVEVGQRRSLLLPLGVAAAEESEEEDEVAAVGWLVVEVAQSGRKPEKKKEKNEEPNQFGFWVFFFCIKINV